MGYRLFFILLFFVFFVEMTGAKPPKKKENEVVEVNRIMDSVELSHFSDSVSTVLGFCKKELDITTSKTSNQNDSILNKTDKGSDKVFVFLKKKASFPGGESELEKFLSKNIVYPKTFTDKKNIQIVYVNVTVNKEGEICNPKIAKSAGSLFDLEALKVIKLMPKWSPAETENKKVDLTFYLPIKFSIQ